MLFFEIKMPACRIKFNIWSSIFSFLILYLLCNLTVYGQDTLWYSDLSRLINHQLDAKTTGEYLGRTGGQQGASTVIQKNGKAFIPISFEAGDCCYWKGFNINQIGPKEGFPAVDSLYWRFEIAFDEKFDFRWGGKIGWAMCAANIPGNGHIPPMGSFSITLMWRTHDRNGKSDEAFVDVYMYHPRQEGPYPKGGRIEAAIMEKEKPYVFEFWLNRINQSLEVRMNGLTIMQKEDLILSKKPIRWSLQMNNFFGGSNPVDWAPREKSVCYVGDLLVLDKKPSDW